MFHHVGFACASIPEALAFISETHKVVKASKRVYDPIQQAEVCLVEVEGKLQIELIAGKQVENLLSRNINIYHIAYEVEEIESTLTSFEKAGSIIISSPKPSVLFDGRLIAFVHTPLGIMEFIERAKP